MKKEGEEEEEVGEKEKDNTCKVLSTGEAHEGLSTQGFPGGWSRGHALPGTYPNPRLPGGKQVFSLYHTVCTV